MEVSQKRDTKSRVRLPARHPDGRTAAAFKGNKPLALLRGPKIVPDRAQVL